MAIDISSWTCCERNVRFRATDQKTYFGEITSLQEDKDGTLQALIVVISQGFTPGGYAVQGWKRRGDSKEEWEFIKVPEVIRNLELAVAEAEAKEAEQAASEKRERVAVMAAKQTEEKEADFGSVEAPTGVRARSVRDKRL